MCSKKNVFIVMFVILIFINRVSAQQTDIGVFYGRFYAVYNFKDYGKSFRNLPCSQYNPFPSIVINKIYSEKISGELRLSFMDYVQYTGTRLYTPSFYSKYKGGNINATINYSITNSLKFEWRFKSGLGLGLIPDMYEGLFEEMFVYPTIDSISRGNIKRNFTPVFPTVSLGSDISYRVAKRFKISLAANYQKGFFKITEYDIYYNDGSGSNDQRAKQWGTGDFYGIQLGVRYLLRDEKGNKFEKKKK